MRKYPATHVSHQGEADHAVEIRGRWKGRRNGRVVNRYISVEQLPTDARVAGKLCVGGPIKYKLKQDSGVAHQFLIDVVVPRTTVHYQEDESNNIAMVLAPALLWACFEPSLEHMMSPTVRQRVRAAYLQRL